MKHIVCRVLGAILLAQLSCSALSADSESSIGVGANHSCAISLQRDAYCWGSDVNDELGNGDTFYAIGFPAGVDPAGLTMMGKVHSITTSQSHSCALNMVGEVWCWGSGPHGRLGNGSTQNAPLPTKVPGGPYREVSAGGRHTCAIDNGGAGYCWGLGLQGQLGTGSTNSSTSPVKVDPQGLTNIGPLSAISAGAEHTCAIDSSGVAWCWGYNANSQLGTGQPPNASIPFQVAMPASGEKRWIQISAGEFHTCAIDVSRSAYCWGTQYEGALGNGVAGPDQVAIPTRVDPESATGMGPLRTVRAGGSIDSASTCAVDLNGGVWCWGSNSNGQLGIGAGTAKSVLPAPVDVSVLGLAAGVTAVDVAVGDGHACAAFSNSRIACWGNGDLGELGTGSVGYRIQPEMVQAAVADELSSGAEHTCALNRDTNQIACWGNGIFGQLGDPQLVIRTAPQEVEPPIGTNGFTMVRLGTAHSCALTTNSRAWCWGTDTQGQLGDGISNAAPGTPVEVAIAVPLVRIDSGGAHSCGLESNGKAWCWGSDSEGKIGDGTFGTPDFNVEPTPVVTNELFSEIATGASHTCAIDSIRTTIWCWGAGSKGQLGQGQFDRENRATPVRVNTIFAGGSLESISASGDTTCVHHRALNPSIFGKLFCWGGNKDGQLGTSDDTDRYIPVMFGNSSTGVFTVGESHICNQEGNLFGPDPVYCSGLNTFGQLADETVLSRNVPTLAQDFAGATSLSAGREHTCAGFDDGLGNRSVSCVGNNAKGQLGIGNLGYREYMPAPLLSFLVWTIEIFKNSFEQK